MAGDSIREQYFPVQESDERGNVAQLELNVGGVRRLPRKFTPYRHSQLFVLDPFAVAKKPSGRGGQRDSHERIRFRG